MSRADQEAEEASSAQGLHLEGRLIEGGGRSGSVSARPPSSTSRYRLKRSIQLFPASDGSLYLLRSGSGEDFVLAKPTAFDLSLLDLLAKDACDEERLVRDLRRQGLATANLGDALAELEEFGLVERQGASSLLSAAEAERYDRQLIYFSDVAGPGVPADALQHRLGQARVVILGCGGLGSWVACGLACAGVGTLVLVDDDQVELSNLNRQLLFRESDIGRAKVEAAGEALQRHNPELSIRSVKRRVRRSEDLDDLLEGAALLIATADWPPYELARWVNAACLAAGVPYISAGQFLPLVRVGPCVVPGESACQECLERAARRDFPLYDELARARATSMPPAATMGAASGVVGSMLAMEAIHLLTGACRPATINKALIIDLRTMATSDEIVEHDPECPACSPLSRQRGAGAQLSAVPDPRKTSPGRENHLPPTGQLQP